MTSRPLRGSIIAWSVAVLIVLAGPQQRTARADDAVAVAELDEATSPDAPDETEGASDRTPSGPEPFAIEDLDDGLAVRAGREIQLSDTILFHYGKEKVREESRPLLNRVADLLKSAPEIDRIEIHGHTDATGKKGYNRELSRQRADVVLEYLVARGIRRERLVAFGHGESMPLVPNDTRRNLQTNRRVEFVLHGTDWEPPPVDRAQAPPMLTLVHVTGRHERWRDQNDQVRVRRWETYGEGVALATGADSFATWRLDDLGRLQLGPDTKLKVVRLDEGEDAPRNLAVKLVSGELEWVDVTDGIGVVLTAEGSFELTGASASLVRTDAGTVASVHGGTGAVETGTERVDLVGGAAWSLRRDGVIEPLGTLPETPRKVRVEWDGERRRIRWTGPSDVEFRLEVAEDPEFAAVTATYQTTLPELWIDPESAGYVRVLSLREDGARSLPSQVAALK